MEENNHNLSNQEETLDYISPYNLMMGIRKYKSIQRAFRRGDMTTTGILVPHRPFNNRKNTSKRSGAHSRSTNEIKKRIYARVKYFNSLGL